MATKKRTLPDRPGVRVGVRTRSLSGPRLRYIRQLGVTDLFVDHADVDEEPDEFNDRQAAITIEVGRDAIPSVSSLVKAREHVEAADLTLTGIQSLPYSLYGDIMFDREGADDALDQIITLIRNLSTSQSRLVRTSAC